MSRESIASYRRALELAPDEPLIRIALGHALVETGDDSMLDEAAANLTQALKEEPDASFAWRLLATVYSRQDNMTMASYAMAESALLQGDPAQARFHAEKAERGLKIGEPAWLRVQDVKQRAQTMMAERKRNG